MFYCSHPSYFRQHLNLPGLSDFWHVKNVSRKPYFSIVTFENSSILDSTDSILLSRNISSASCPEHFFIIFLTKSNVLYKFEIIITIFFLMQRLLHTIFRINFSTSDFQTPKIQVITLGQKIVIDSRSLATTPIVNRVIDIIDFSFD